MPWLTSAVIIYQCFCFPKITIAENITSHQLWANIYLQISRILGLKYVSPSSIVHFFRSQCPEPISHGGEEFSRDNCCDMVMQDNALAEYIWGFSTANPLPHLYLSYCKSLHPPIIISFIDCKTCIGLRSR